jgi:predicted nuclease of predicted toxin-antitoxin system
MNLSPKWVSVLNTFGWRSIHWSSVGRPTATDSELMDFAREHGYVVLTHDLDFSTILAVTHGEKPSVVQIRTDDISPLGATKVITALSQFETEPGALISMGPERTRVRLLPLPPES